MEHMKTSLHPLDYTTNEAPEKARMRTTPLSRGGKMEHMKTPLSYALVMELINMAIDVAAIDPTETDEHLSDLRLRANLLLRRVQDEYGRVDSRIDGK